MFINLKATVLFSAVMLLFANSASAQTTLRVGNLAGNMNEEDVREIFSDYGKVLQVRILRNSDGSSKGIAFVIMADASEAKTAISELNGGIVEGRAISVRATDEYGPGTSGEKPNSGKPSGGGWAGGGRGGGSVEKALDESAVKALVAEATGWLSGLIDDEEITDTITSSWDERDDLIGKTRTQVLDLMLIDAKSAITEKVALDKFVKGWKAKTSPAPAPRRW